MPEENPFVGPGLLKSFPMLNSEMDQFVSHVQTTCKAAKPEVTEQTLVKDIHKDLLDAAVALKKAVENLSILEKRLSAKPLKLTWQDVFAKVNDIEGLPTAAVRAHTAGYKYFRKSGRVFEVLDNCGATRDTGLAEMDVK
jgi:hypothetical protein